MTAATAPMARNTGATQGRAATVTTSPRMCKLRSSGSLMTASPIHCGAMNKERVMGGGMWPSRGP